MSSTSPVTEDFGDAVLIIGAGLAGLAAAHELIKAGKRVVFLDQEPHAAGQAFWSYGGIFFVDSPQQRWMGIKDNYELARRDWFNSAQFNRGDTEDKWAIQWAEEYLRFAADHDSGMYKYLADLGLGVLPLVGWAERGAASASGHGNSVPRFHITWGTGPGLVEIFEKPVRAAEEKGLVKFLFRHKVDQLVLSEDGQRVIGAKGSILEPSDVIRGAQSSREAIGTFGFKARATIVATGGIGGNPELIRQMWPTQVLGKCPDNFVLGVPHHVDGSGLALGKDVGGAIVNPDRFWFYTEGVQNWDSIWPNHGIRIIAGPSSFWLDAEGERLPAPLYPGCDTISTFKHILSTGYDYTWMIMDQQIRKKEMALSGSEQNLDLTERNIRGCLDRILHGAKGVRDFVEHGIDWITRDTLEELVEAMNELIAKDEPHRKRAVLDTKRIYEQLHDRDIGTENQFSKDPQLTLINQARNCRSERWFRVAPPHKVLDPANGPLLAIRLSLLTRKTLGGLQTNLDSQVLRGDYQTPIKGFYAVGEVCGFGGGGIMGHNALEGTFVTGAIYSGMKAGLALARDESKL